MLFFSQPPIYGAYLYDAVKLYAIALNKTLASKQEPTGEAVFRNMRDFTFESRLSFVMTFGCLVAWYQQLSNINNM